VRRALLAWLGHHGLPAWLCPGYFQLTAIGALLASAITLKIASRDQVPATHARSALACAYVGALLGGYLFESLLAVPGAIVSGAWHAVLHPGRAAYGGLIFGAGGAALYLWRTGQPLLPFWDRLTVGAGAGFALVRVGCFISGCDYGLPSALPWAVRFPSGSLAALDHARRGFVPMGASSLPVHPTQLYESGLGILGSAAAAVCLARGRRDGSAFAVFVGTYAVGRFAIEFLRGELHRGHVLGLSTAQWLSLAIVIAVSIRAWRLIDHGSKRSTAAISPASNRVTAASNCA
jgi:prolipoprotein diacylglyceryltransferase